MSAPHLRQQPGNKEELRAYGRQILDDLTKGNLSITTSRMLLGEAVAVAAAMKACNRREGNIAVTVPTPREPESAWDASKTAGLGAEPAG